MRRATVVKKVRVWPRHKYNSAYQHPLMMTGSWTYAKAGVDIDAKSNAIRSLVGQLDFRRSGKGTKVDAMGHFAGLIDFGDVYLTLCTDGVGTKLLVAESVGRWDTVGIDCIAMNVNDAICVGSEPMAFVDYVAIDRPDETITQAIGMGLETGARMSNMDIVGGEIAVLPDMVHGVDISGTCLGYVPKDNLITGEDVVPGDVIVGLSSSGIHSNGLTLARKILEAEHIGYSDRLTGLHGSVGEELLEPTRIYVKDVMPLVGEVELHGMVNITGGGLRNFLRLKEGVRFVIEDPLPQNRIFTLLSQLGKLEVREAYQTFNMGMGFAIICPEDAAEDIIGKVEGAKVVGRIDAGSGALLEPHGIEYDVY